MTSSSFSIASNLTEPNKKNSRRTLPKSFKGSSPLKRNKINNNSNNNNNNNNSKDAEYHSDKNHGGTSKEKQEYVIGGVKIVFPFKAYPSQITLISKVKVESQPIDINF